MSDNVRKFNKLDGRRLPTVQLQLLYNRPEMFYSLRPILAYRMRDALYIVNAYNSRPALSVLYCLAEFLIANYSLKIRTASNVSDCITSISCGCVVQQVVRQIHNKSK